MMAAEKKIGDHLPRKGAAENMKRSTRGIFLTSDVFESRRRWFPLPTKEEQKTQSRWRFPFIGCRTKLNFEKQKTPSHTR